MDAEDSEAALTRDSKKLLMTTWIVATMIIPSQVTLVPLFIVFKELGWLDSFKPLIVPHFFGVPFYIFLLRQFFLTIPNDLGEAAKIDGASEWQTYLRVMLPLAKPVLATVCLFTFLSTWNDFLGPSAWLNSADNTPACGGR